MNPESIQNLLEQGLYHYGLGEIEKAIELWRQVLALDPDNETAREYINIETGGVAAEEPELPVVEPDYEVPAAPAPAAAVAPQFIDGQHFLQREEWLKAINSFEKAYYTQPDHQLYWPHVELAKAALVREITRRMGGAGAILRLKVPLSRLLDRKDITQEDGFVLSLLSGDTTLEDVVALSPLPNYQTYNFLYRLSEDGLVEGKPQ